MAQGRFVVGINYPWLGYGHDFGPAIVAVDAPSTAQSSDTDPVWNMQMTAKATSSSSGATPSTLLEGSLDLFKSLGISVVRWFIYADGWNFPPVPTYNKGKWSYDVGSMALSFQDDFKSALKSFAKMGMQMMPVLVDQKFFGPGKLVYSDFRLDPVEVKVTGNDSLDDFAKKKLASDKNLLKGPDVDPHQYIKGGKLGILLYDHGGTINATKSGISKGSINKDSIENFMEVCFDPLLAACKGYEDQIYAWDILNEPEVGKKDFDLPVEAVSYFLNEGVKRVWGNPKLCATVGFQVSGSESTYFPANTYVGAKLAQGKVANKFVMQFHYYPNLDSQPDMLSLPKPPFPSVPTIVGEFASKEPKTDKVKWDVLSIDSRLAMIQQAGYAGGFLWSANDTKETAWNKKTQDAVKNFTGKL
jgi:hypothetical protein